MAQDFRHPRAPRSDEWRGAPRGGRYQGSDERDQHGSGDERRFAVDDRFDDRGSSYRDDRSYSQGGYPHETGYRRDERFATARPGGLQARSETTRVSHRGRGPKGYVRSEERLREMICECLTDDPWVDASDVNIEVSGQTVKLTGTVAERRAKHRIEDLIEQFGVRDIDNQIRVTSRPDSGRSPYSPSNRGGSDTAVNDNAAAASTSAATGAPSTKRS